MTSNKQRRTELTALPMLPLSPLYIGVDIGKFKHIAGLLSKTLLARHKHFEHCPAFTFEQSREGFRAFMERIQVYCPLEHCFLLMEQTGHYHRIRAHNLGYVFGHAALASKTNLKEFAPFSLLHADS